MEATKVALDDIRMNLNSEEDMDMAQVKTQADLDTRAVDAAGRPPQVELKLAYVHG